MKPLDPIQAYNAVNKFLFYGWNWKTVNFNKVWMPEFVCYVNWNCDVMHVWSKWIHAYRESPANPLAEFWKELDMPNRMKLVDWIIRHYNEEPGRAI